MIAFSAAMAVGGILSFFGGGIVDQIRELSEIGILSGVEKENWISSSSWKYRSDFRSYGRIRKFSNTIIRISRWIDEYFRWIDRYGV